MPLVIVTGLPSSGKSTAITHIYEDLVKRTALSALSVVLHTDESLGIPHEDYRESRTEKSARGVQMSAIKRDLTKNTIVILDSLCYIKGFRYQLFCEAKSLGTPHCVVQLLAPLDTCLERNAQRADNKWDPELIRQLEMRYEEPDNRSRWDSPLFPILYDDQTYPTEEIWQALTNPAKQLKPNNATMLKPATSGNFLQDLDRKTQLVVNKIVEYQTLQQTVGGTVVIEKGNREEGIKDLAVELPLKVVSTAQLQRNRRGFIALNRVRAVESDRIVMLFVGYLNNSLSNEE